MDQPFVPGLRCRATRAISHRRGIVDRSAEGTVRATRDNIGRRLVTVDFDCGDQVVVFEHELEIIDDAREAHR